MLSRPVEAAFIVAEKAGGPDRVWVVLDKLAVRGKIGRSEMHRLYTGACILATLRWQDARKQLQPLADEYLRSEEGRHFSDCVHEILKDAGAA